MPRKRRRRKQKVHELTAGQLAWFRGDPVPLEEGPLQSDFIALTYFTPLPELEVLRTLARTQLGAEKVRR